MKKLLLLFMVLGFSQSLYSQVTHDKLLKAIKEAYPGIDTKDKIIAVNFWSKSDQVSREANVQLAKNYQIYQAARLKGGLRGLIAININEEDNKSESDIYLNKDGASKPLSLAKRAAGKNEDGVTNLFFDSNGQEIYRNVKPEEMFIHINALITR